MKKYGIMLLALLACGAVYATQDATLTQREVRDPRQLEVILEANATDAESRLADIEAGTGIDEITVNNATVKTNITIGSVADAASYTADPGSGIDAQAAGALDIGNTTATSIDYGSSAVTVHTFTSDGTGDTEFVVPDGSISATEMATAVQTSLGLADSALQNADVWGAPGLTVTTNSTSEVEVAIQTKTIAGGDLAERRFIRVYAATTEGGVASAADTTSFVLSTGTAVETFLADADYSYVTAVAGTALLTVTSSGASTKWITVIDGSSTTETRTDFTGP